MRLVAKMLLLETGWLAFKLLMDLVGEKISAKGILGFV